MQLIHAAVLLAVPSSVTKHDTIFNHRKMQHHIKVQSHYNISNKTPQKKYLPEPIVKSQKEIESMQLLSLLLHGGVSLIDSANNKNLTLVHKIYEEPYSCKYFIRDRTNISALQKVNAKSPKNAIPTPAKTVVV